MKHLRAIGMVAGVAVVWGVLPGYAARRTVAYEPEFYEVSEEVVTPHVAWAKPYAGGAPRVLIVAPWFCHRHTVELAQRLELDYTVCMTTQRHRLGYPPDIKSWAWVTGTFQADIEAKLRRKLRGDYDAIVLGSDWKALPLWAVYDILKKVEGGTGLLIGYRQSEKYLNRLMAIGTGEDISGLLAGIPWAKAANLDGFDEKEPLFAASSLGAGRVIQLRYSSNSRAREYITPLEKTPASKQDYELYQCIAIRALLWCAKREPALSVAAAGSMEWSTLKAPGAIPLRVDTPEVTWRARVEADWVDADGRSLAATHTDTRLPSGGANVQLPVPALPAGRWFANVRVLRDGEVAAWACIPVTVTGTPDIEAIAFAKQLYEANEPVRFTTKLSAPAQGGVLRFRVTDAHGRLVRTATARVNTEETQIAGTVVLPAPLSVWHLLQVELLQPGRETPVALCRAEFFREWRLPKDEFGLLTWYGPSQEGYMDRLINRAFAASGVNIVYPSHVWGEGVDRRCIETVRAGLSILPYICHIGTDRNAKAPPHVRVPAVTDPKYRSRMCEQVRNCARQFRRFCPVGYSLGDENCFAPHGKEYCGAPTTVAYFREWLQRKYGNVKALNRAWRDSVKSFDDIQAVFLDDARKTGRAGAWIDFRLCMEDSWTGIFSELQHAIAEIDPAGKVGHEGSGGVDSYRAFDYWTMLRDLSLFVPYPGRPVQGNLVRSLRNPGTMSGYWYGSYTFSCGGRRPTTQRYFPWYCLFQAYNSSWYFNSYGHAAMAHEVGFAPDLRPLPHFQTTAAACAEIETGFDKLLLNSERAADGIAVYYSPAAIHENTFRGRNCEHKHELDGVCKVLNDLSLQYNFVAYAQVRDGILKSGKYRVLVLPLAVALSAPEAAELKKFAESGGNLLADVPPALADEHGYAYAQQPLAGLFGRQPASTALKIATKGDENTDAVIESERGGEIRVPGPLKVGNANPGTLKAGGTLGKTPLVLAADGNRAVLLNFAVDDYGRQRHEPRGAALRLLFADILARWGIEPPARVLDPDGNPLDHIEAVRFTNGPAVFLGIMPEDFRATEERTRQAVVHLHRDTHIYDMRRKRYLGKRATLPVTLRTCDAELFGLLPYVVGRLELTADLSATGAKRMIRCSGALFDADGKPVGSRHAVVLRLIGPEGRSPDVYRRKVLTEKGRLEMSWTLAEDDPVGTWTIVGADVASGIEERAWVRSE